MDALTHAVEAYIGNSTTIDTRRDALKAVKLIFENIDIAYEHGDNIQARRNMLHASFYAGCAFTKSYVGYVHAVAHSWADSTTFPMDLPMPFCCRWYFGNMAPALTKSSTDLPLQQDLQTKIRRTMKQQSFLSGQLKR